MKKLFFTACACLLATMPSAAQFYPDGRPIPPRLRTTTYRATRDRAPSTYVGLRVGMGVSTVSSDSPLLDTNKAVTGLQLGVVGGVALVPGMPLYLESGVYYAEKGGKSTYGGSKFTYDLNYIEVPIVLKYKYQATRDVSVEPFVGGYLAGGVGGKIKDYDNREAFDSFGDEAFKRFDGGLRVGCGLGFQMMYVEASYDVGLSNIGQDLFDDTHNGCLNLTFGVNF